MPETAKNVLDRRLVDRLIRKGLLTRKDLEKQLKTLEDKGGDAVPLGGEEVETRGNEGKERG